jgi:nicotinate-nucleotide pyrophosphorylase (carboxylating)
VEINTYVKNLIELAIAEDIGDGDHTSLACISPMQSGEMELLVKQEGIIAGVELAGYIFSEIDPEISTTRFISDGAKVKPGDKVFLVKGKTISLLQAERLVLNIMQRMSGVATQTHRYAEKLHGLKTKVLDTRKTTPGMRILDKWAVKIGGGENHRMGLFDMILIKDNHIDFAGGIEKAIQCTQQYLSKINKPLKIEIEARNLNDVRKILHTGEIHRILLDNFTIEQTKNAVELINGNYETESSGGITIETLRDYAMCGVDYISVGALTHQIKSLDLSLKAVQ